MIPEDPVTVPDIEFGNPINDEADEGAVDAGDEETLRDLPVVLEPPPPPLPRPQRKLAERKPELEPEPEPDLELEPTVLWREDEGIVMLDGSPALILEAAEESGGETPAAAAASPTEEGTPPTPVIEPPTPLAAHLFVLAGAVSADALHRGRGEFSLERLRTDNVTIAYSTNDSVLRDAFWLGEAEAIIKKGGGSAMKINPSRPTSLRGSAASALAHAQNTRNVAKTAATAIGYKGPTEATLQSSNSARSLLGAIFHRSSTVLCLVSTDFGRWYVLTRRAWGP